jgi:hypothetical protein
MDIIINNISTTITLIAMVVTLISMIITLIDMTKTKKYKDEVIMIKNSLQINNQKNFVAFNQCSDIKDSSANQININNEK